MIRQRGEQGGRRKAGIIQKKHHCCWALAPCPQQQRRLCSGMLFAISTSKPAVIELCHVQASTSAMCVLCS